MAKRFIETDLFRKPHIRALEARHKLLWVYIACECDHAGVWEPELDVAGMRLGTQYPKDETLKALGKAVVVIEGGQWILRDFIEGQYGSSLNPENRVHKSVLDRLLKLSEEGQNKPLISPLLGAMDKYKDKGKKKKGESEGDLDPQPNAKRRPSSKDEVEEFAQSLGLPRSDGAAFFDAKEGNGWRNGANTVKDWKATLRNWKANGFLPSQKAPGAKPKAASCL